MASLSTSSIDSYQSCSCDSIKCPLCLEKVSNHLSFMTKCKHSWCFKCNEGLNQNRINRCPICKSHFEPFIKKGRWLYINHKLIWKRGVLDSQYKTKWKKRQEILYNFFNNIEFRYNGTFSGV